MADVAYDDASALVFGAVVLLAFAVSSGVYIFIRIRASRAIPPQTVAPRSKAERIRAEASVQEQVLWSPFFVGVVIAFAMSVLLLAIVLWTINGEYPARATSLLRPQLRLALQRLNMIPTRSLGVCQPQTGLISTRSGRPFALQASVWRLGS